MLGAFRSCFKGQNHDRDSGKKAAPKAARASPTSPDPPIAPTTAPSRQHDALEADPTPSLPPTNGTIPALVPGTAVVTTVQVPLSPFARAMTPPSAPAAHAPASTAPRAAEPSLEPFETLSSHCSSLDSSLVNSARPYLPTPSQPRLNNGHPAASYTAQALGPNLPAAATISARPEELLMLGPLDNNNMGLMARPASLQLHQLNRQITNLQKIGQGAGGIVYRGLWTGVNVAIKFLKSSSPDQLNQTAKEAILSRFVSHPNVVQTYTYDVTLLVDSVVGPNAGGAHSAGGHPNAALPLAMPGIMEEDPDPMLQSRETVESHVTTSAQPLPLLPDPAGLAGGSVTGAPAAAASVPAYSLALVAAGLAPLPPVQTTPSLAIFDVGSRSTMDVRASIMSQPDVDSMLGSPGWDMQDVLLRLGAKTGEYLTHIIMELCDAGTLQQAILNGYFGGRKDSSSERAKCRALLKTAREVVSGMQHLHSLGIIHGDLKPGNVLLRKDASSRTSFIAKVGDFGLAQRCGPGAPEVQAGVPLGTLCYAAPEALRGLLLKTSDVYSFGVMLWQMCSGAQPFNGLHPAQILYGKQTGSLKLTWPLEVYSPIRKLGELCTEMDPGARPHFDQIFKALVQIEQRLQQAAKARAPVPVPVEPQMQQQPQMQEVYELMPDPEILP